DGVIHEPRVRPSRRLSFGGKRPPGVLGGRVCPRPRVASRRLDVAAAEEDETAAVAVITHRRPQQRAAQLTLGVACGRKVFPLACRWVVTERASSGIEVEALR